MYRTASRIVLSAAIVSVLTLAAFAAETPAPKAGTPRPAAPHAAAPHAEPAAMLIPASELKWNDVADFPGLKTAPVHGDPGTGPSHFFMKLPAGFTAGMHYHNADHWVAVVTGTLILTPEGGKETKLPAGSGFGFTGKKKHATKCAEGADCLLFIDARDKWDIIPVDQK